MIGRKRLTGVLSGMLLLFSVPIAAWAAMTTGTTTDTQLFSDVNASNPNYQAIMYLKGRGIVNGYPDGTFKPDQVVNRAEATKIILLGSGIQVATSVDLEPFRDTDRTSWYAVYVSKAKDLGIVSGYADGTFKPDQTVNLVENLKVLLLAEKVDLSNVMVMENPYADALKDQWYAKYAEYAKEKNLIDADSKNMIYPAQGMTRGKLAEAMYRLMYMQEMHWDSYMPGMTQQPAQPTNTQQSPLTQQTGTTQQPSATQQTQQTTQQTTVSVAIQNIQFSPADLTVKKGTTVVWTNKDLLYHSVTSTNGTLLDSPYLSQGQSYSMTFDTVGTYTYHCKKHPSMTGTVTVTE